MLPSPDTFSEAKANPNWQKEQSNRTSVTMISQVEHDVICLFTINFVSYCNLLGEVITDKVLLYLKKIVQGLSLERGKGEIFFSSMQSRFPSLFLKHYPYRFEE